MNNKDNLHNAFEKAFEDHQAPLHQAQWDRLDAALMRKKQKRRFLPWIFFGIALTVFSVGFGYWIGNKSSYNELAKNEFSTVNKNTDKSQSVNDQNQLELNNQTNISENLSNEVKNSISSEKSNKTASTVAQSKATNPKKVGIKSTKFSKRGKQGFEQPKYAAELPKIKIVPPSKLIEESKDGFDPKDGKTNTELTDANTPIEPIDPSKLSEPSAPDSIPAITTDSTKKDDGPEGNNKKISRFAIGIANGVSNAVFRNTTFTDPDKMHEDTKGVFEESVKNTRTQFINVFCDVKVLKKVNLTLSTGVQYRQIEIAQELNYMLNKIPWRSPTGVIDNYFNLPAIVPSQDTNKKWDTLSPIAFNISKADTNMVKIGFVSIPVAFSYILPINSKSEVQFTAGVIFNKVVLAKGKTFSVNTASMVNYNDVLSKKGNMGYLAGVSYYRNLYKPWWLGIGAQIQQNKVMVNTGYGYIMSNINISSFSLNLKYKF